MSNLSGDKEVCKVEGPTFMWSSNRHGGQGHSRDGAEAMSHVKFRFDIQAEAHGDDPLPSSFPVRSHSSVQAYPIKLNAYCEFSMYENGCMLLKVEGQPEVIATMMAAWWAEHGADHIRDRLGGR